jgi:hypothetical protein
LLKKLTIDELNEGEALVKAWAPLKQTYAQMVDTDNR